jgi:hypothetical protein
MFLFSGTNRSHLQDAIVLEGTCNVLRTLPAVRDELYTCGIIPQLVNNYELIKCIKIITKVM